MSRYCQWLSCNKSNSKLQFITQHVQVFTASFNTCLQSCDEALHCLVDWTHSDWLQAIPSAGRVFSASAETCDIVWTIQWIVVRQFGGYSCLPMNFVQLLASHVHCMCKLEKWPSSLKGNNFWDEQVIQVKFLGTVWSHVFLKCETFILKSTRYENSELYLLSALWATF